MFALMSVALAGCSRAAGGPVVVPHDARPPGKAPVVTGISGGGPPPAWVKTKREALWLGYSSFCWTTTCADYMPPRCGAKGTPTLRVNRGEVIRFHLAFAPSKVMVLLGGGTKEQRLEVARTPSWRVTREGTFLLSAKSKSGSASYAGCLRFSAAKAQPATRVSWPEALRLIRLCKTKVVGQTHQKLVALELRSGRKLFTYEPHIDDVMHEVTRLRRGCGPTSFWTE